MYMVLGFMWDIEFLKYVEGNYSEGIFKFFLLKIMLI